MIFVISSGVLNFNVVGHFSIWAPNAHGGLPKALQVRRRLQIWRLTERGPSTDGVENYETPLRASPSRGNAIGNESKTRVEDQDWQVGTEIAEACIEQQVTFCDGRAWE